MHNLKLFLLIVFLLSLNPVIIAQSSEEEPSGFIRINQIGYYPNAIKKAVIASPSEKLNFQVVDLKSGETVFKGTLSEKIEWELSGETVRIADFTDVSAPGSYMITVEGIGRSYPFEINKNVLHNVLLGSVKGLYFQRSGTSLPKKYAGKWHREMGHPDTLALFHESSGETKGGKASPKGWYDAGDYNKYVINGSFPLGQFFMLYERYPELMGDHTLNIPESGNQISDYLDELKYELDWLLTMQDDDGGLFHKLTTKKFEGMVMPNEATNQRYIVGKGTAGTLDFAASTAMAYRVYKNINKPFADSCLKAAKEAYAWAELHPDVAFENPNDIHTGQYGDDDFTDEWFWARSELFLATKDQAYLNRLLEMELDFSFQPGESWTEFMRFIGMFSLMENKADIPQELFDKLQEGILATADDLVLKASNNAYRQPIDDFHWGSNSDVLNAVMICAQAYRLNPKFEYLNNVQQAADYILGNNALGFSFVTGFGAKPPLLIHHRQSSADGIEDPVPGLLSGGSNSRRQDEKDGTVYPENVPPMKSWVDQEPSYASNEICLNWNAPLTYILGFLEAESK